MTLDDARALVGQAVVYRAYGLAPAEVGQIVRVGERYVFVQYVGDWPGHAKATPAESLELLW